MGSESESPVHRGRHLSSRLAGEVARRAGGFRPPRLPGRWPEGPAGFVLPACRGGGPKGRGVSSSPRAGEVARGAGGDVESGGSSSPLAGEVARRAGGGVRSGSNAPTPLTRRRSEP